MRGVKYTAREKEKALTMWLSEGKSLFYVAKRFCCHERTLWRWKARYDGSRESLENGSAIPKTPHKNAHTKREKEYIKRLFRKKPEISYIEALGILRQRYSYGRTYFGFYRFVVKNNIREKKEIHKKYVPKPYDTPNVIGTKMQMDVKYVPRECNCGDFPKEWLYQYTMIDETTRERFIYPYKEKSGYSTIDFVKRAIVYFGYVPKIIQTDNGTEFTNPKGASDSKIHIVDRLLNSLNIRHQLIRAYTPRHNGKVERSHRSDQESFYNHLQFATFEELKMKMEEWMIRYNNRPHTALRDKEGKRVFYSPLQKRKELVEDLAVINNEKSIRFIKRKIA